MGTCWNCGKDVFLKDEEVRCDSCKQVIRYWCNACGKPFDVQDKGTKNKIEECKWCGYFKCPNCQSCGADCQKTEHINFIKKQLIEIIPLDKYPLLDVKSQNIVNYFEEVKMGRNKTMCEFGVPRTYAKERVKQILARMGGFKVRDEIDQTAFEKRREEILDKSIGYEFTIGNTRIDGTYGQEYRDVFNLCVCLGKLKYQKKSFKNDKGIEIGYDSWTRIEASLCEFLDIKELIVKYCPNCKRVYSKSENYCSDCSYKKTGKKHEKGSHFELIEKISDNPTCKNLKNFIRIGEEKKDGDTKTTTESRI